MNNNMTKEEKLHKDANEFLDTVLDAYRDDKVRAGRALLAYLKEVRWSPAQQTHFILVLFERLEGREAGKAAPGEGRGGNVGNNTP